MPKGNGGSGFIQRIAAAWLDAAVYSDHRADLARPHREECIYWEELADRYEAQSRLCLKWPSWGSQTLAGASPAP